MAIEVKKIHTDNLPTYSAMSGSHISENRVLRRVSNFVIFEPSVIVDILFFRFISIALQSYRQLCVLWLMVTPSDLRDR